MKRKLGIAALGLAFVMASADYASAWFFRWASPLQGEYSFVGSATCAQSNKAFVDDQKFAFDAAGNNSMRTEHFKGVLRLYWDGTGTLDAIMMHFNHNFEQSNSPMYVAELDCKVVHERFPDGTIEMTFDACKGNYLAGGGTGSIEVT